MPILRKRVKANSKIKQQQLQTLIKSKIFWPFSKTKFNNKVNIPSDEPNTKQNNL